MQDFSFNFFDGNTHMVNHHFHDSCEIYYQLKGQKYYFINDKTYPIIEGDLVLIKERILHKTITISSEQTQRYLLNINRNTFSNYISCFDTTDLFRVFDEDIFIFRLEPKAQKQIELILNQIYTLDRQKKDHTKELHLFSLVLQLLIAIYTIYTTQNYLAPSLDFVNKRVHNITEYINQNYMNNLTLQNTAATFNISSYYLCKLFKTHIGFTFSNYLNQVRIKAATDLLLNTSFSITEVGESVGYADTSYFIRTFKKTMSLSPLQYRKLKA